MSLLKVSASLFSCYCTMITIVDEIYVLCGLCKKVSIPTSMVEHDLPAINVTIEWIVQLVSCNHEHLIYKAFGQGSEVFNSGSEFGIKYSGILYLALYVREEIISE